MEKIAFNLDVDWLDEEGNPVIVDGIALRDIKDGEKLISYGKII